MLKSRTARCGVAIAAVLMVGASLLLQVPLAAEPGPPDSRAALALQPELVDRVLGELEPAAGATGHLYFVGFAGYGRAGVFKREVVAVRELFNERFGTRGRSVALINHISTMNEVPLASTD